MRDGTKGARGVRARDLRGMKEVACRWHAHREMQGRTSGAASHQFHRPLVVYDGWKSVALRACLFAD